MEASSQSSRGVPGTNRGFTPQETLDHPFDVTLLVEDGKEFKAHRRILSEASTFFEKLLSSDMKESNEGVIRLEMITEVCLRDILEFIYTGSVQISAEFEDNARDLIVLADYLVLPHLKTIAGNTVAEKLNVSSCVSTYHFAENYHCEKLLSDARNYILSNFSTVAKTEEFLNLSSDEVKMCISSDEINVSAEEDVFKIILTWIDHEKNERKEHFAELFREVRLVYISRDFLRSDIVTNDLVNDNEGCMDLVKDAVKFIDSKSFHHLRVKPRKSLEIPVIAVSCVTRRQPDEILCYYPRVDKWSRFRGTVPRYLNYKYDRNNVVSCHGNLYLVSQRSSPRSLLSYDSFSSEWESFPNEVQRKIDCVCVSNEGDIFALMCEYGESCSCRTFRLHNSRRSYEVYGPCDKRHISYLMKYTPESNSWQDITSRDMGLRVGVCVVATENNFIYFLGGSLKLDRQCKALPDADRYDLSTNTWEKIADLQEPWRRDPCGAAAYGKIYIACGGMDCSVSCEVYHEATNEWQFIARPKMENFSTCLCADGKFCLVKDFISIEGNPNRQDSIIEYYDPDKNEWQEIAPLPLEWNNNVLSVDYNRIGFACLMRVFKGSKFLQQASYSEDYSKVAKKCVIM